MRISKVLTAASALCGALAFVISGCGGKKGDQGPSPSGVVERGGTLTVLASSDVDFLDPGRVGFTTGVMVVQATQRTLYRSVPSDLSKVIPDLAAAPPVVSGDGRIVTVKLRHGVRFSPPVNREVTSADVEYAFDRIFSANVEAPYASYFRALAGVPKTLARSVPKISGITTPDRWTIRFRLTKDVAPYFVGSLSLPITAPVPPEYARPFDAKSPSTYNEHVVATGPYMVRNDASGRTVGYQPGTSIDLVRNPSWSAKTDTRPAYLDHVKIQTNASDSTIAARQVLAGHDLVLNQPPPATIIKRVAGDHGAVSARVETGGYRFVPLNTTMKPFDDINVRRAVLAVFDRNALRLARGGASTGPLATHFLPPGIPGFEEAGGLRGPGADYLAAPKGDPALAAEYMRKAGFPSGKYTGKQSFLIISGNDAADRAIGETAQAQFGKLGFRTRLKFVPPETLFSNWCATPANKVLSCASSILWLKDFVDPEPALRPVFDGDNIAANNNTNFSQLNDPKINQAMERAASLTGAKRAKAWGDIDRMIVADAPAVPVQWDVATLIHSKDVVGTANATFVGWDLSYTGLRG